MKAIKHPNNLFRALNRRKIALGKQIVESGKSDIFLAIRTSENRVNLRDTDTSLSHFNICSFKKVVQRILVNEYVK